jgi:(p)ppGpp synthase/HD superfamily hydrolase
MNETLVTKATKIAKKVHEHQVDKKNYPYMSHVLDVASRVSHLGESFEIVGLLHDAIEDSESDDLLNEILEEVNTYFDEEVIDAIHAMTKIPGEDYFHEYLPRLKKNKIALQVKIADSSHNLSKAHLIEDKILQDKLRNKYIKVLNELGVDGKNCEKLIINIDGKWIRKSA